MRKVANILSIVFHPLLAVTYGLAMALSFSYLAIYPMKIKLLLLSGAFLMTAVVPAASIYLMAKEKKGVDWELSDRRSRTMPYLIYVGSVMVFLFFLFKMMLPFWVLAQLFGAAVATLLALCVNFFWKISAHMVGIGGLLGGLMGISRIYAQNPYWGFIALILIAGSIGTSRLYLRKHTPFQIYCGFGLGFIVIYISSLLSYFYFFI